MSLYKAGDYVVGKNSGNIYEVSENQTHQHAPVKCICRIISESIAPSAAYSVSSFHALPPDNIRPYRGQTAGPTKKEPSLNVWDFKKNNI